MYCWMISALTIFNDEPVFLPIWLRYYSQHADRLICATDSEPSQLERDAIALHGAELVVTSDLPSGNAWDEVKQKTYVEQWMKGELQRGAATCVYTDVDEFLIPSGMLLRTFCGSFAGEFVRAVGYQVVHQARDETSAFDPSDPLSGRSAAFLSPPYNKTLVTHVPLRYTGGFHSFYHKGQRQGTWPVDSSLHLVHTSTVDIDLYCEKLKRRRARWRPISPTSIRPTKAPFSRLMEP